MLVIQFEQKIDAVLFFARLQQTCVSQPELAKDIEYTYGKMITFNPRMPLSRWMKLFFVPVMVDHILEVYEERWMIDIIESKFMYRDKEEQEQIAAIAKSIIDGEKQDIPLIGDEWKVSRQQLIKEAFVKVFDDAETLLFDSFVRFRLRDYRKKLSKYIEAAIDEYKLEQEYQNFIEDARRYISLKKPLLHTVYIVHDTRFKIYNENFQRLKPEKVMRASDEQFLRDKNLDPSGFVIAPLLTLAPETLWIYSDEQDHGMVRTLQNIFEERVIVQEKQQIPSHYKKDEASS